MVIGLSSVFYSNDSNAQLVEGNIVINANYGVVPVKGLIFRGYEVITDSLTTQGLPGHSTSFTGPVGIQFQYMLSDKFGIGLDASYQNKSSALVDLDVDLTIIRAMVRTSLEFYNTEKFQMNWANSIGYRSATYTFSGPLSNGFSLKGLSPLAMRTALGLRYLFTENIGLSMELGLGGGNFINTGLTVKL